MPSVRSAHTVLPACLAIPPDDLVGLFIACMKTCRSELARDEPEDAAECQVASVIVDDHREQARSYRGSGSGQRLEGDIDVLQNLGLALLAPIQGDHLLVGLNLVDIVRQFFEMIEQHLIFTDFLPLVHPDTR